MSPPTPTPTETAAGHDRQVTASEVTSKREAFRTLRAELGITGAQAHRLYVAYEADIADAHRIGNTTARSDASFLSWLMSQAPGHRNRPVRKWRVGEAGWRTAG